MTSPTLRISFFAMFMSIDFAIGFIPFGGLIIGWLILPSVYVLSGKKYAAIFWIYDWLSTIPTLVGSTSSSIPVATAMATHQTKAITMPAFIVSAFQSISSFFSFLEPINIAIRIFDSYVGMGMQELPVPLRLACIMGIFFGILTLSIRAYIKGARQTLSAVPQLISYGIISPNEKAKVCPEPMCQYHTFSDWYFKRHVKRGKHKK